MNRTISDKPGDPDPTDSVTLSEAQRLHNLRFFLQARRRRPTGFVVAILQPNRAVLQIEGTLKGNPKDFTRTSRNKRRDRKAPIVPSDLEVVRLEASALVSFQLF